MTVKFNTEIRKFKRLKAVAFRSTFISKDLSAQRATLHCCNRCIQVIHSLNSTLIHFKKEKACSFIFSTLSLPAASDNERDDEKWKVEVDFDHEAKQSWSSVGRVKKLTTIPTARHGSALPEASRCYSCRC